MTECSYKTANCEGFDLKINDSALVHSCPDAMVLPNIPLTILYYAVRIDRMLLHCRETRFMLPVLPEKRFKYCVTCITVKIFAFVIINVVHSIARKNIYYVACAG